MTNLINVLIKDFFGDRKNSLLFFVSVIITILAYIFWQIYLKGQDIYVYDKIGIYPIKFLAIIFIINSSLAFTSYQKDKQISHLLFIANIFLSSLMIVLEIYYFVGLKYGTL